MKFKDEEEKQGVILHYLKRSDETFKEAVLLASGNFWNGCASRLYYAAFHSVNALLVKNNHHNKTHSGVRNLLSQYFVKTNILTSKEIYLYTQLFDKRQEGDYGNSVEYTEEDIFYLIEPTKEFIETVKNLIES